MNFQSVKTGTAGEEWGIDGGKTKGRKRYIVGDVLGCLLFVIVHAANIHDTKVLRRRWVVERTLS